MTINERMQYIVDERFNGNKASFAKAIGIPPTSISNYLSKARASKPTSDLLEKIINIVPGLNASWLLTGVGEPFKEEVKLLPTNTTGKGVPYFEDIEASCSILSMNMDIPETPTFYIDYEHFNDCNAYIPVVGDSMYPQYCAGEIVAVKQIHNFDVLQWGEAYLIITNTNANDLRTIKQIHYCEDDSKIILRASNPNYRGDTKINKADILSMFIIKGKIKRNQL